MRPAQVSERAHIRDACGLYPSGDTQQGERREISRELDDILSESLAIFKDDTSQLQDIEKDIENEVAIAQSQGHTGARSSSSSRALGTPALG
jgi:hypothetical protein